MGATAAGCEWFCGGGGRGVRGRRPIRDAARACCVALRLSSRTLQSPRRRAGARRRRRSPSIGEARVYAEVAVLGGGWRRSARRGLGGATPPRVAAAAPRVAVCRDGPAVVGRDFSVSRGRRAAQGPAGCA